MVKFIVVAIAVVIISVFAWVYFPHVDNISNPAEKNAVGAPSDDPILEKFSPESKAKNHELYDLKSSINHVISDSVQEEIKQAVQDGVLKTTKPSERE